MAFNMNNGRLMSEINVTPFVDVMLVLLIIFMVTAPMMIKGAQVSLPEAEMSNIKTTEDTTVVTVDKNLQIYINDYQTTIEAFPEKLDRAFFNKKNKEILLKADKEVPYGVVVKVMSEIKNAGITKIGMLTDPLNTKKKHD
ncbi:MAG: protein TolR [Deltaproteobacteria bacterium]|nr:protein TolR [Deltaproteobacteria bacterium]